MKTINIYRQAIKVAAALAAFAAKPLAINTPTLSAPPKLKRQQTIYIFTSQVLYKASHTSLLLS